MKTRIVPVTILSLVASLALAADNDNQGQTNQQQNDERHEQWHNRVPAQLQDREHDRRVLAAPEIDLSQAAGALILLSGTVAVIRGYRRKK